MKGIILFTLLFLYFQTIFAQCDKKVTFTCEKARSYKNGTLAQEKPINATISIDNWKFTLTATMNGRSDTVEGDITEVITCEWTGYLKNGRTRYKALIKHPDQDPENGSIDIESENGYTKITFGGNPVWGEGLQFDVSEYLVTEDPAAATSSSKPGKKSKKGKKQH